MKIDSQWLHWPETKQLAAAVSPLRFVGGAVRDALLNREVRDVDAATPLPPEQVIKLLTKAGIKAIPTGIDHGTVTAIIGEHHFEITTLRRDVTTDGRHATVAYTDSWQEDAARRDFTMNALYADGSGEVFDYTSGVEDALAGNVHFIGDAHERIKEDSLRILRFFRFFAHYGKGIVNLEGITACGELASLIEPLSGERIQQEMLKLLIAESAAEIVGLMQRHGVWPFIVKNVVKTETLAALPAVLRKTGHTPDPILSLALLLRTASGDHVKIVDAISARWKFSKAQNKKLLSLCDTKLSWLVAPDTHYKKQIRGCGKTLFIERLILAMAEGAEEAAGLAAVKLAESWEIPAFPITGDDLIAAGITPGQKLGQLLHELETAWEESGYSLSKDALLKQLG